MKPSFGIHRDKEFEDIPENYLCWICAAHKGGTLAKSPGQAPFRPPERDFLEARRILKSRGYNTKGIWPVPSECTP